MATPASDFSPEVRAQAWWSGDSRKAADGKANEAILIKLGKMEPPDFSDNEAAQMGHVMEPVIGRLAQQKLGVELNKLDHALAHKSHPWLRSHFDFVGEQDGQTILVEAKNYGMHQRNKFDPETGVVPPADLAQVIHEAAVFDVSRVYLAVLFGGQEFTLTRFDITDEQKDELIRQMAVYWAHVQAQNPLPPETPEQARLIYPVSRPGVVEASRQLEADAAKLKEIKAAIKRLETDEATLSARIQEAMGTRETLVDVAGTVLATWKSAASSKKFNNALFQQSMPDIYQQFIHEVPGSRRFLVK
jgi:predicted phage-related endonuclease